MEGQIKIVRDAHLSRNKQNDGNVEAKISDHADRGPPSL
jgi:hypothetical protein